MTVAPATEPRAAAVERCIAQWRAFTAEDGATASPAWVRERRQDAIVRFAALGFPGPHDEAWRFTNVAPIVESAFAPPVATPPGAADAPRDLLVGAGAARHAAVFVNGRLAPTLSGAGRLPRGVTIGSLATAMTAGADTLRHHLGRYAPPDLHAFAALNAAFLADGAYVHIPAGTELEEPLQLLFLTAGGGMPVHHPRVLLLLDRGARATVVETYAAAGATDRSLTNAVTEIVVGEGARLDHYRIQREGPAAFHVGVTHAVQERDSVLHSTVFAFGAALARHDLRATLDGPGATLTLNGLSLATGHQHLDHHTTIDHAQPHGESHELFNGIFDGRAHGVFTGRIVVRPGAQGTDSKQTNNNLLLSDEARADSQPQLEIYADDVKCTHGSTTGPLDPAAVFYLKSRGLGARDAKRMLTYGFGAEIVSRIELDGIRAALDRLLRERVAEALR